MLVSAILDRLWLANVAINVFAFWRSVRYQRKRYALICKPITSTDAPAEVIARQSLLIEALSEQSRELRQLSEQQRQFILRKHPSKRGCKRCQQAAKQVVPPTGVIAEEPHICPICWHNERDMAFQCGHVTCHRCSLVVTECPLCRVPIRQRLKLFM